MGSLGALYSHSYSETCIQFWAQFLVYHPHLPNQQSCIYSAAKSGLWNPISIVKELQVIYKTEKLKFFVGYQHANIVRKHWPDLKLSFFPLAIQIVKTRPRHA